MESCLFEENRRSIKHLVVGEKSTEKRNRPPDSSARQFNDTDYVNFNQGHFREGVLKDNILQPQPNLIHDEEAKQGEKQNKDWRDIPLIDSVGDVFESGRIKQHSQDNLFRQTDRNDTNASKFLSDLNSDHTAIRQFPPVYQTMLLNGLNCSKVWRGDTDEVLRAQMELNDTLAARRSPSFYQTITENCDQYRRENG